MLYIRLIKNFYIGLTLLAILMPMEYGFLDYMPGIALMWLIYGIYNFTSGLDKNKNKNKFIHHNDTSKKWILLTTISYLIFYPIYTKFYTGSSIYTSIFAFKNGISNYANYQAYFLENELNSFSISKLPYILGHSILKLLFIYQIFRYFIYQSKKSIVESLGISIMTIIYILVGITRGTSFELFEIFNLYLFVYIINRQKNNHTEIISLKSLFYISVLIFFGVTYFVFNIKQRYGGDLDFTMLSGYNKNSIVSIMTPSISILLFSLYGYFTFGLHYTSILVYNLWSSSIGGLLSMFVPDGISKFGFSESSREFVNNYIEVGAKWTPETVSVIEHYGILSLLIIISFIGFYTKYLIKKIYYDTSSLMTLFFIYLYMISLPIGNFLTVSSSNKICLVLTFILTLFNKKKFYV
jgi:hypothetical protein